jgi:hypothetical protein
MNALIKLSNVKNFTSTFEASQRMPEEDDNIFNSQHVQAENLHERFLRHSLLWIHGSKVNNDEWCRLTKSNYASLNFTSHQKKNMLRGVRGKFFELFMSLCDVWHETIDKASVAETWHGFVVKSFVMTQE